MTPRHIIIALGATLVLGLAVGRFSLPAKIVEKTKVVEVERKVTDTQIDKTDHSITTVTESRKVDGTVTKVTKIQKNIESMTDRKTEDNKSKSTEVTKEVTRESARWSLNALGEIDLFRIPSPITYGGQVEYRLMGPIRTGFFGFSDGKFGISLGIQF